MLDNITIVLVNPSHPGNIGAAARAMKTMGLSRLRLVQPADYPCAEATARASGADDILARAEVCANLEEAVADCVLVAGTSARSRTLPWPLLEAREAAGRLAAEAGAGERVALLFGRERTGLTNDELARCHFHVTISSNPDYSSLNLAAAVQILAYELRLAAGAAPARPAAPEAPEGEPVTQAEMEGFYGHLERVLVATGFLDPESPKRLLPRLRRLYARARPDRVELNILRGMLKAMEKHLQFRRPPEPGD